MGTVDGDDRDGGEKPADGAEDERDRPGVGETDGFEPWYAAEHPRVLAALVLVAGDLDQAREAVDEAFSRALARWPRVAGLASPTGWVYTVALNCHRRARRRAAIEQRLLPRLVSKNGVAAIKELVVPRHRRRSFEKHAGLRRRLAHIWRLDWYIRPGVAIRVYMVVSTELHGPPRRGQSHACTLASSGASIASVSNVLIRGVPPEDLERIRAAAAARGTSLQNYLLEAVRAQASYLRRQEALARTAERLRGQPEVPESERAAVLDAIDTGNAERAGQLADRPPR